MKTRLLKTLVAFFFTSFPLAAFAEKPVLPTELSQVGNAMLFIRIDGSRLLHGPDAKTVAKLCKSHPIILICEEHKLDKMLGMPLTEIDSVVFFLGRSGPKAEFFAVFSTRKPFDRAAVLRNLVPNGKDAKAGEKRYIVDEKGGLAVQVLGDRSFLIGSPDGLKARLTKGPGDPGVLAESLTAASKKPLLAAGIDNLGLMIHLGGELKDKKLAPLKKVRYLQISADGKNELALDFRFVFETDDQAKDAVPAVSAFFAPLDAYLEQTEKMIPDLIKRDSAEHPHVTDMTALLSELLKSLRAELKTLKPVREGAVVNVRLRIKTDTPAAMTLMLASLIPRPAKK